MTASTRLFSPLTFKNFTLKNRLVVSPMCQYSATDGFANDWHLVHLGQFAIGQAAAVIQEATAVQPNGRITYGDLGLWKDEQIDKLKQICQFIKDQQAIPGIQLAHAGRKASTDKPWQSHSQFPPTDKHGWQTVAPSNIPYHQEDHAPTALSLNEIEELVEAFKQSAIRAQKAGYQIIEIHGAHGYLIHQFLSPLINKREDQYGGSFENRIRLLLEIVDAVKQTLGDQQSLWVRISASDWAEGGWNVEESIKLTEQLKAKGVELIDVSSGGAVHHQKITVEPGYQLPFARAIRQSTGLTTGAVGLITEAKQAEAALEEGTADVILLAREFLRDPHAPLRWAHELKADIRYPEQYERAKFH